MYVFRKKSVNTIEHRALCVSFKSGLLAWKGRVRKMRKIDLLPTLNRSRLRFEGHYNLAEEMMCEGELLIDAPVEEAADLLSEQSDHCEEKFSFVFARLYICSVFMSALLKGAA